MPAQNTGVWCAPAGVPAVSVPSWAGGHHCSHWPSTPIPPSPRTRFLDRWITLSSARELGELFVPALAALGRSRRHDAVVGICSLIVGDGCEGMRDLPRATNALVLGGPGGGGGCLNTSV